MITLVCCQKFKIPYSTVTHRTAKTEKHVTIKISFISDTTTL